MFDFYQKRKLRAVVNSPITQGVILALALMVGWSAYVRFEVAMEMRERRVQADLQAAALEQRKVELEKKVDYLSSKRGIESELRRQFDVALPGEQVVVIIDDEKDESSIVPLSTSTKSEEKRAWYQFWR